MRHPADYYFYIPIIKIGIFFHWHIRPKRDEKLLYGENFKPGFHKPGLETYYQAVFI